MQMRSPDHALLCCSGAMVKLVCSLHNIHVCEETWWKLRVIRAFYVWCGQAGFDIVNTVLSPDCHDEFYPQRLDDCSAVPWVCKRPETLVSLHSDSHHSSLCPDIRHGSGWEHRRVHGHCKICVDADHHQLLSVQPRSIRPRPAVAR